MKPVQFRTGAQKFYGLVAELADAGILKVLAERRESSTLSEATIMKYYFSILAAFKNETRYLREWIEYHRLVGAEHFYLYNNDDDPTEADALLQPYIDSKIIDLIRWEDKTGNRVGPIFTDGLRRAKGETTWLAFFDLDEFLHPLVSDSVPDILRKYELPDVACLGINWLIFGSSGHKKKQLLQIDSFRKRGVDLFSFNNRVKCIVRPDRVSGPSGGHSFKCIPPFRSIDENMNTCNGPFSPPSFKKMALHHYFCRSEEDMIDRSMRLRLDGYNRDMKDIRRRDRNDVLDERICRFLPALKRNLGI